MNIIHCQIKIFILALKDLDLYDETHLSNEDKINYIKEAEDEAFSNNKIVNTNGSGFGENKSNFYCLIQMDLLMDIKLLNLRLL